MGIAICVDVKADRIDLIFRKQVDTLPILNDLRSLGLKYSVASRKIPYPKGIWAWARWRLRHGRQSPRTQNIPFDWVYTRKLWTRIIYDPPISLCRNDNILIFDLVSEACRDDQGIDIDLRDFARKVLAAYHVVLPREEAMDWAKAYYR